MLRRRTSFSVNSHRLQEITINTNVKNIKDGKDDLPPLRNPPLLETADDLATLSHLNEPSGEGHRVRPRFILCLTHCSPTHDPQSLCPA
jgi:myosin heavy subunit